MVRYSGQFHLVINHINDKKKTKRNFKNTLYMYVSYSFNNKNQTMKKLIKFHKIVTKYIH